MRHSIKSTIMYINLDRVPQRRRFMEKEFLKVGLNSTFRFSAIDAKDEEALKYSRFCPGAGDRWELPRSAIACFESHRAVWQFAVDQELDTIVVFEDDVLFSPDIAEIILSLVRSSSQFDIIKLDIGGSRAKCGAITKIAGISVRRLLAKLSSAGGYILSASGAKKLLKRSKIYGDTLDDFLFNPSADWYMYQLFPAAVAQVVNLDNSMEKFNNLLEHKVLESEREESQDVNKKNLSHGPIPFRLYKEFKRIKNSLMWKFYGKKKLLQQGGYYGYVPISKNFEIRLSINE